jgi:hypothetical protein
MPVNMSPPATSDTSLTSIARTVDPAFEERWNAWVARGHQHESAVRRKLRFIAIAAIIAAVLVFSGWALRGGFP